MKVHPILSARKKRKKGKPAKSHVGKMEGAYTAPGGSGKIDTRLTPVHRYVLEQVAPHLLPRTAQEEDLIGDAVAEVLGIEDIDKYIFACMQSWNDKCKAMENQLVMEGVTLERKIAKSGMVLYRIPMGEVPDDTSIWFHHITPGSNIEQDLIRVVDQHFRDIPWERVTP